MIDTNFLNLVKLKHFIMKKTTILSIAFLFTVLISCKQDNHHDTDSNSHVMNDSTMMHNDSTMNHNNSKMINHAGMYSCPMHPEVHGNKNDKCSKCGMDLTLTEAKESE